MKKLFSRLSWLWLSVVLTGLLFINGCNTDKTVTPQKQAIMLSAPQDTSGTSNKVYTFVEQMPSFPGGQAMLMKYLSEHIHYPKVARENGIQGTVVVQFIVDPNGKISSVKTVSAEKGGGLEDEAIQVVKGMPAWHPGMQDGRKVTVQYNLPIRFVMQ